MDYHRYPEHSIGPISPSDKKRLAEREKSIITRAREKASRLGDYWRRFANQVPKSFVQAGQEIALKVADPESMWISAREMMEAEKKTADAGGMDNYLEGLAQRAVEKVDTTLSSPEALADAAATIVGAKMTRGARFQETNLDEALLGAKTGIELSEKDYSTHPQPWREFLDFPEKYDEAKRKAREPGRKLAPLWNLADRVDYHLGRAAELR